MLHLYMWTHLNKQQQYNFALINAVIKQIFIIRRRMGATNFLHMGAGLMEAMRHYQKTLKSLLTTIYLILDFVNT